MSQRFERLRIAHAEVQRLSELLDAARDELNEASDEVLRYEEHGYHVYKGLLFIVQPDCHRVGIEGDLYFPSSEEVE